MQTPNALANDWRVKSRFGIDIFIHHPTITEDFDSGSGTFLQRGSPPPPPWRLLPGFNYRDVRRKNSKPKLDVSAGIS